MRTMSLRLNNALRIKMIRLNTNLTPDNDNDHYSELKQNTRNLLFNLFFIVALFCIIVVVVLYYILLSIHNQDVTMTDCVFHCFRASSTRGRLPNNCNQTFYHFFFYFSFQMNFEKMKWKTNTFFVILVYVRTAQMVTNLFGIGNGWWSKHTV